MTDKKLIFGVTGANGYLGSVIKNFLRQNGHKVLEFRHDMKVIEGEKVPFSLNREIEPRSFNEISILIHCAYDFNSKGWDEIYKTNVLGSEKLFKTARTAGVSKIIYISSMSAFDGCRSFYGKAKLLTEKKALEYKAIVIRPGLIYGKNAGGIIGSLNKMLSLSPIIPLMGMGLQKLYLIHQDDLCRFIMSLCVDGIVHDKVIIAAHNKYRTFKEILQTLSLSKGKKKFLLPFPWQLIWLILRIAEMLHIRTGLRSDSLISLVNQDPSPNFEYINNSGASIREFNAVSALQ